MQATGKTWFGFWRDEQSPESNLPLLADWVDPLWTPQDRLELIEYVRSAPMVVATSGQKACALCDAELSVSSFQSDGAWLWPQDLGHYMANHGVRLPDAFAMHIKANGYQTPDVVNVKLDELSWPE